MEPIYLAIVIILAILAVSDLVVGVSNDAVNFLNSAIGSRAASRRTIMWVATLGIMVGVLTSSGMMEVARNGIFHPGMFPFSDIMLLFLAVMLTDVILLDVFNTLGLPTSTTVSLVFELLGAAMCIALFNIADDPAHTIANLNDYINTGRTLGIISGILTSVVIAFVCGSVIMYITRLIFSYKFNNKLKSLGAVWCGIALTAITYFALFKGLKGTPLIPDGIMNYINANIWVCVAIAFVFWSLLMSLLACLKVNILRITVLSGTFALALAFAGNDLVNFIGVFMAGYDSYNIAIANGADTGMLMGALNEPVHANIFMLAASGVIMAITLWVSKKARRVTDTEVNLAKQDAGDERFDSTSVSRALVRQSLKLNKAISNILPKQTLEYINSRFQMPPRPKDAPSFDLIRATVNLTVASLLISLATSLKLPLSTTYVTFMVAMGSSLADRAWGRESAVYRITGVMTVILGWFVTAFVAFLIAFVVAAALFKGGIFAIIILCLLCIYLIIHSNRLSRKKRLAKEAEDALKKAPEGTVVERCINDVIKSTKKIIVIYNKTLDGVFKEDRKELKKMLQEARELHESASDRKYNIVATLDLLKESNIETAHYYVQVVDYLNEITKSMLQICKSTFTHIDNNHEGLTIEQVDDLKYVNARMNEVFERVDAMLVSNNFTELDKVIEMRDKIFEDFAIAIKNQIKRNTENKNTTRSSVLYLNILTEDKIMILQMRNMLKAQKYFVENESKAI